VAEIDPLRDEALQYALALLEANVSVELHLYSGTYHAFDYIAPFAQVSQRALADQVNALSKALRS
jgi:acetyl esterase/lipase